MIEENSNDGATTPSACFSEQSSAFQSRPFLGPLAPRCDPPLFFLLQSKERQAAIRQSLQKNWPMPPLPRATFLVITTNCFFPLSIALLNQVTFMLVPGQTNRSQVLSPVAQ